MKAKNASSVMVAKVAGCGACVSRVSNSGRCVACVSSAAGPPNITKVTNTQTVMKLGGVDLAGAEQYGERRHRQCHEQRQIAHRWLVEPGRGLDLRQNGA